MKNKLLLTTAIVAGFVANVNAIEYTPYVSGKLSYVWMQNDVKIDSVFENKHGPKPITFADEKHKDDVFGLRLAAGAKTPVLGGHLRGEVEFGWNAEAKDSNMFLFSVGGTVNDGTNKYESKLSVYSAMLNVYYDINTNTAFTPYVGAGIGYAHLKNKSRVTGTVEKPGIFDISSSKSANNFAYNLSAGVAYALSDNLTLDVAYRYSDYGNIKDSCSPSLAPVFSEGHLNVKGKYDVTSHEVMLGMRYSF